MRNKTCTLIGVPVHEGAGRYGCEMGPNAYRAARLGEALSDLGYAVVDRGNLAPPAPRDVRHPNAVVKALPQIAAWTEALAEVAYRESAIGMPIFMGGDHSLSAGTLCGIARRAAEERRELFVLWLDAHPDFHTLETTETGNLHGTPVAYLTGHPSFSRIFPPIQAPIEPRNLAMMGVRRVDPAERTALASAGITVFDMRMIDENGVRPLLSAFLERVRRANGMLHVSFDVDFLDPDIAPGVGTPVEGGITFREAHLIMEILHDSGLVTGVDLVELNPFLDERGRTAFLMVDLLSSLMGRRILDRPKKRA